MAADAGDLDRLAVGSHGGEAGTELVGLFFGESTDGDRLALEALGVHDAVLLQTLLVETDLEPLREQRLELVLLLLGELNLDLSVVGLHLVVLDELGGRHDADVREERHAQVHATEHGTVVVTLDAVVRVGSAQSGQRVHRVANVERAGNGAPVGVLVHVTLDDHAVGSHEWPQSVTQLHTQRGSELRKKLWVSLRILLFVKVSLRRIYVSYNIFVKK